MKTITHILFSIFLLGCTTGLTGCAGEQNAFVYTEGKSFESVEAYAMSASIDLAGTKSLFLHAGSIPGRQQTIVYEVELPEYVRGLFFSRDLRPGDHQWPNNTNRLLPWSFNRLEELTQKDYPGIPSNGSPSLLGDALLLELADGNFLFAKGLSGENSLSWFRIDPKGSLHMYVSTLGTDALEPDVPVILQKQGRSVYEVTREAYQMLRSEKEAASIQERKDKAYFEAFRYLGWCSWEHYHMDIDEAKITADMAAIEASEIPVRYVLIDDGHIANDNRQLLSLTPDKERFPHGWKPIMDLKKENKIKWIGVWYSLAGYWAGISDRNDFPEKIRQSLFSYNGTLVPGKKTDQIETFYNYFIGTLQDNGFDFLKIDNQSFSLPLYMGGSAAVRQARACNLALEEVTHRKQMGLVNCMAQNILNIDHTQYSSVARVSIDYKKFNRDMAKSHLFQSYTNTLLQGQTVWPDHDMFHSSDSICGDLMARSKALSGGPVYLSDAPAGFVKENIMPLIDEQGKLFRPSAPAIPTPECILSNPLRDGIPYRVFAPVGDEAVSLICYNLNTDEKAKQILAPVRKRDYGLRETLEGKETVIPGRILLYDWKNRTAEELTDDKLFELDGFTDRLFHLCPIREGWAIVGLQEKYLSPATVQIISRTKEELVLNVQSTGTLCIWAEKNGKQELRKIPVRQAGHITLKK